MKKTTKLTKLAYSQVFRPRVSFHFYDIYFSKEKQLKVQLAR